MRKCVKNNIKIISYYNYTMKLLKPFLLCIPLFFPVTCEGFIMPILQQTKTIINPLHLLEPNRANTPEHYESQSQQLPMQKNIKNKIGQIMNLIRVHHIAPTLFLCISGGWLMNPSIFYLLHSVTFVVFTINIILIMSASMAINDLYDIEMDRINSPQRPLVTGAITKKEAIFTIFLLLGASEYLSLKFLPSYLQTIMHLAIIYINIYTPILKKILVLKNISCAALVSLSVFLSALATTNKPIILHKNFDLLLIACNLIFTGSWANEILLDIRDYEGDNQQGLATLPTTLGKQSSWTIALLILYIGMAINSMTMAHLFNLKISSLFLLLTTPQLYYFFNIIKNDYSHKSIETYMKHSNKTLVAILLFIQNIHFIHF